MSKKRFAAQQIIGILRKAEVKLSHGMSTGIICREAGIAEQTYYRWRREYGGIKTVQARRLKDLEIERWRLEYNTFGP
ncbi:MAG TPA: transposase, partial [Syntrophales bacterium]|nr:transposase [Syntrophales bacterium]